jgi:hypothetical protein
MMTITATRPGARASLSNAVLVLLQNTMQIFESQREFTYLSVAAAHACHYVNGDGAPYLHRASGLGRKPKPSVRDDAGSAPFPSFVLNSLPRAYWQFLDILCHGAPRFSARFLIQRVDRSAIVPRRRPPPPTRRDVRAEHGDRELMIASSIASARARTKSPSATRLTGPYGFNPSPPRDRPPRRIARNSG